MCKKNRGWNCFYMAVFHPNFLERFVETPAAVLPEFRRETTMPFNNIGLDFAGPFKVQASKVYVLLFVCATIRAVHLELCLNMGYEEFDRAYRRFTARRGNPKIIVSDNFKTFIRARSLIHGVQWSMIPPRAPWWGGFYERFVGLMKAKLTNISTNISTINELATLLC